MRDIQESLSQRVSGDFDHDRHSGGKRRKLMTRLAGSAVGLSNMIVRKRILGLPYGQDKPRGRVAACDEWTEAVVKQTSDLPQIAGPCVMRLVFILPSDKCPTDHPYGNDLDNLLKRFCDALQLTVLRDAPGRDGAIIRVEAEKIMASPTDPPGVDLELEELPQPQAGRLSSQRTTQALQPVVAGPQKGGD
jgi:Holliday junction resolvase RusA-like endonuclease